jgi:hypothetical protein
MMRTTAKAPLTGTKGLLRSSIEERLLMPPNREKLSVAVRIRADRIFPEEVAIAGAGSGNQALPSEVGAIALSEDHRGAAVKRGNKVAEALQAVRARAQVEVVDAPPGAAAAAGALVAVEAVVAVAVAAEVGDGRERETAQTVAPTVASERKEFVRVDGSRSWLSDLLRQ